MLERVRDLAHIVNFASSAAPAISGRGRCAGGLAGTSQGWVSGSSAAVLPAGRSFCVGRWQYAGEGRRGKVGRWERWTRACLTPREATDSLGMLLKPGFQEDGGRRCSRFLFCAPGSDTLLSEPGDGRRGGGGGGKMGNGEGANRGKTGSGLGVGGAEGAPSSPRGGGRRIREFGNCGRRAYQDYGAGFWVRRRVRGKSAGLARIGVGSRQ